MDLIALIAAMHEESGTLLRLLPSWQACRVGSLRGYRFRLGEHACLMVESGMGMQRAEAATRALLAAGPRAIISFGIAGAVQAELHIGDVVVVRQACRLEQGIIGPGLPLAELPVEGRRAAEQALRGRGARLIDGSALTTRGEQILLRQTGALENPVLEMETTAIAAAAAQAGLPVLGLRGISDNPQEPLPFDLGAVMDDQAHLKIGTLLGILVRRPQILLHVRRLQRNTALAAENAAAAVMAVVSAMSGD